MGFSGVLVHVSTGTCVRVRACVCCLMVQQVPQLKMIFSKKVPGGKGGPAGLTTDDVPSTAVLQGSSSRSLSSAKNQESAELRRMQLENLKQKQESRSLSAETTALASLAKLMQLKAEFLKMETPQGVLAATRCQHNIDVLLKCEVASPSSVSGGDVTPRSLARDFYSPS